MTHEQIIAELVRIWHSPHLDLSLKVGLAEVIETLKEKNQSDSLVTDSSDACKESESKLDLISRRDAISEIDAWIQLATDNEADMAIKEFLSFLKERIETLPSAEAAKGEWIDIDNYYRMATCSHCLKVTMFEKWGEYTRPYNFCPNCGAKMYKGGDDE